MMNDDALAKLRSYRLDRVRQQLAHHDIAGIIMYDPINIRYATDASNMQVWHLHNPARYCFIANQGPVILFDYAGCMHITEHLDLIDERRTAKTWFYFCDGPRAEEKAQQWTDEISDLVRIYGAGNKRLAVDRLDPLGAYYLGKQGIQIEQGQPVMEQARAIKSSEELVAIRESIRVCQLGMDKMYEHLRPGITETQLWSWLHQTNIANGGEWIETRLLTSGPRTNPWFNEASDRIIEIGDMVSFDTDCIGTYGYCTDISRSWICGETKPSDDQRRIYAQAHATIESYIETLKPGMSFLEFSNSDTLPASLAANRYVCMLHGVGMCDEYPYVGFPDNFDKQGYDGVFQEGMTVCVEAYAGELGGKEGVKLEEQLLITADGVERLSSYKFEEQLL